MFIYMYAQSVLDRVGMPKYSIEMPVYSHYHLIFLYFISKTLLLLLLAFIRVCWHLNWYFIADIITKYIALWLDFRRILRQFVFNVKKMEWKQNKKSVEQSKREEAKERFYKKHTSRKPISIRIIHQWCYQYFVTFSSYTSHLINNFTNITTATTKITKGMITHFNG